MKNPFAGLKISSMKSNKLEAYSNADWEEDEVDRRSQGGYCVFSGGNLVTWSSRKQSKVAYSTTEAEYRNLADAAS